MKKSILSLSFLAFLLASSISGLGESAAPQSVGGGNPRPQSVGGGNPRPTSVNAPPFLDLLLSVLSLI